MDGKTTKPTLPGLFLLFARVSAITIGGGYVMFPILQRELVDSKDWITDEELVDYYALGQAVPGIIAINAAGHSGDLHFLCPMVGQSLGAKGVFRNPRRRGGDDRDGGLERR